MTADQKTLVPSSSEERDQQLVEYLRDLALEQMPAEDLLRWASETFPGRAVLNTSFQYTGVAMIHMATSMGTEFALCHHRHPPAPSRDVRLYGGSQSALRLPL